MMLDVDLPLCISSLPKATDEILFDSLKRRHQNNSFFGASSDTGLTFAIQHFAGRVEYQIKVESISQTANIFFFYKINNGNIFKLKYMN